MGAIPSRESQNRGFYGHRHGRHRRSDLFLVPLTQTYFPSPDCPLFQHLAEVRHRQTPKYHYRPIRDANRAPESDYFCLRNLTTDWKGFVDQCRMASAARKGESTGEDSGVPYTAAQGSPGDGSSEADFHFARYSDTLEGLYQVLVKDNEVAMLETDQAFCEAYARQIKWQQEAQQSGSPGGAAGGVGGEVQSVEQQRAAWTAGQASYALYMEGKAAHTHTQYSYIDPETGRILADSGARSSATTQHTTSPSAYYLRPIPCAILRAVGGKDGAGAGDEIDAAELVEFQGELVKVIGMYGLFPRTIRVRHRAVSAGAESATGRPSDYVEQHLLQGYTFVEKDLGEQIVGSVVLLGAHMFVKQCLHVGIRPDALPALPLYLHVPISNIPLLQCIRECRVRLRSLLKAGTLKSGELPYAVGLRGVHPDDVADATASFDPVHQRLNDDAFVLEPDVPLGVFMEGAWESIFGEGWSVGCGAQPADHPHSGCKGASATPRLIVSGFHVQTLRLRHALLASAAPHLRELLTRQHNASERCGSSSGGPPFYSEAFQQALRCRRQQQFRVWVEGGHICIWASAAYMRRGCVLLAQQLNTSLLSDAVPEKRESSYMGLLRAGQPVPPPADAQSVMIVAEDIPEWGLYQGDVLRCSQPSECVGAGGGEGGALFWVRAAGGLDDSLSNTVPETLAGGGGCAWPQSPFSLGPPYLTGQSGSPGFSGGLGVRRCDGVFHAEEVLLSWMKSMVNSFRESPREDLMWVRAPSGALVRLAEHYVVRRLDHDGVRFYLGITPNFLWEDAEGSQTAKTATSSSTTTAAAHHLSSPPHLAHQSPHSTRGQAGSSPTRGSRDSTRRVGAGGRGRGSPVLRPSFSPPSKVSPLYSPSGVPGFATRFPEAPLREVAPTGVPVRPSLGSPQVPIHSNPTPSFIWVPSPFLNGRT